MSTSEAIIVIHDLKNYLGGHWVHDGLDLQINRGEIFAIVGGSGSGKTTLLRSILMLQKPTSGTLKVFDVDVMHCDRKQAQQLRRRQGVMFQQSALFSSLNVLENILFPLNEFTDLSPSMQKEMALLKVALVGLPIDAAFKYPLELSGGMLKRAALARAIALDPELLFLDEPTAGLDPHSAAALDNLLITLRDSMGLTIVMVTHELASLRRVTDKVAFLGEGLVLSVESMASLEKNPNPLIQEFFSST